jgi:REP element-mobilizing transposase RayT
MEQANDRSHLNIIAYCLMPNHFHLILKQRVPGAIPAFIKQVCDGYAKAINRSLHRTGHLFEGPYRMKPVGSDEYILHLSRYIHLNPVRAKLAARPEQWEFSSYRSYITDDDDSFVRTTVVMNICGGAKVYRKFVEEYSDAERRTVAALLF